MQTHTYTTNKQTNTKKTVKCLPETAFTDSSSGFDMESKTETNLKKSNDNSPVGQLNQVISNQIGLETFALYLGKTQHTKQNKTKNIVQFKHFLGVFFSFFVFFGIFFAFVCVFTYWVQFFCRKKFVGL